MTQPDSSTKLLCVLGHPISHTLSPLIHNAALHAQGLNYSYLAFDVHPEHLGNAVSGLKALGFAGANVTIPHKRSVFDLVDRLTPAALAAGAVNTLVPVYEGDELLELVGDNTDVEGFVAPLRTRHAHLKGGKFAVLGAGGAARAIVYALSSLLEASSITVAARNPQRAEQLCRDMEGWAGSTRLAPVDLQSAEIPVDNAAMVINCTPVGMAPHQHASIWPDSETPHENQIWYDLVYNPVETAFLKRAKMKGATAISGLDMFVAQGAASYRQWTGKTMPERIVRNALKKWISARRQENTR